MIKRDVIKFEGGFGIALAHLLGALFISDGVLQYIEPRTSTGATESFSCGQSSLLLRAFVVGFVRRRRERQWLVLLAKCVTRKVVVPLKVNEYITENASVDYLGSAIRALEGPVLVVARVLPNGDVGKSALRADRHYDTAEVASSDGVLLVPQGMFGFVVRVVSGFRFGFGFGQSMGMLFVRRNGRVCISPTSEQS